MRIGCAAVVAAAAVALGWEVHHGVAADAGVLSQASIGAWTTNNDQEECIYRAIRSDLPESARVFIDGKSTYDDYRLAELTTTWAVPQPGPATADWTMSLAAGRACSGLALQVRHR